MRTFTNFNVRCFLFATILGSFSVVVEGQGIRERALGWLKPSSAEKTAVSAPAIVTKPTRETVSARTIDRVIERAKGSNDAWYQQRNDTIKQPPVIEEKSLVDPTQVAIDSAAARAQAALGRSIARSNLSISNVPSRSLPSTVAGASSEPINHPMGAGTTILQPENRPFSLSSGSGQDTGVAVGSDLSFPVGTDNPRMNNSVTTSDSSPIGSPATTFPMMTHSIPPSGSADQVAKHHVRKGYELIESQPNQAANEFLRAVGVLAESHDRDGAMLRTESLRNAIGAMIEADVLAHAYEDGPDAVLSVIAQFKTPVGIALQNQSVTPEEALGAYPTFIQKSLTVAGGKDPQASNAYYGLARIHLSRWQSDRSRSADLKRTISLLFAAIETNPSNWRANNELGIILADSGRLDQAAEAFRRSIFVKPTMQALNNLAKVYQSQGKAELAQNTLQESLALKGGVVHNPMNNVVTNIPAPSDATRRMVAPSQTPMPEHPVSVTDDSAKQNPVTAFFGKVIGGLKPKRTASQSSSTISR